MASKKNFPKHRILIQLSQRARREVVKLVKSTKARTLTQAKFDAGLGEAEVPLKQMLDYINGTLDEISTLKRDKTGTARTEKKLRSLGSRMKLMWNWGNGDHPHGR